ncbi:MAG: septum formation protein Maf [Elusimicrobia bacterium RIFOXYD2_FULL_34_15]|nr:MAG: septum formation protein Maf [Elusimicrobia bacterium RIFOXYD2_FULL_34_15]
MKNKFKNLKLILASGSPQRKQILKDAGYKFTIIVPNIKEESHHTTPSNLVKHLAIQKAESVAKKLKSGIVIGSDTIVVLNGEIIGKPKNAKDAKKILSKLSGTWHRVYTGVAIIDTTNNKKIIDYDMSRVKMRKLSEEELEILSKKNLNKAGAYAVQEKGDRVIEKIIGDYHNVVGFPIYKFKKMLTLLTSSC